MRGYRGKPTPRGSACSSLRLLPYACRPPDNIVRAFGPFFSYNLAAYHRLESFRREKPPIALRSGNQHDAASGEMSRTPVFRYKRLRPLYRLRIPSLGLYNEPVRKHSQDRLLAKLHVRPARFGNLAGAVGFEQLLQVGNLAFELHAGVGVGHARAPRHRFHHVAR